MSSRTRALATRWLGVGLASCLAVATITLTLTGQLDLYINPSSAPFAVTMSILLLAGAVGSFALPLGAESEHGHDHGDGHDHLHADETHDAGAAGGAVRRVGAAGIVAGGVIATGVAVAAVVLPPASLSAELAVSRASSALPLFAGQELVTLASSGDTAEFGVGDWAAVFQSATDPASFDGDEVALTGFVTPAADGDGFTLSRLVITHCVIDAQTAGLPVATDGSVPATGQWIELTGDIRIDADGALVVEAVDVTEIAEPEDPYEY